MASDVDLVNLALGKIGVEPIRSLADPTKAAKQMAIALPLVRDEVLRAFPWRSAMKRARLLAVSGSPANLTNYAYQYAVPADLLQAREVGAAAPWLMEGTTLYTDEAPDANSLNPIIRYTCRPTYPELDASLCLPIIVRLAYMTAGALAANPALVPSLMQEYMVALRSAKAASAMGGMSEGAEETEWADA